MATAVATSNPAHSQAFNTQETGAGKRTIFDLSKQLRQSEEDSSQVLQEYFVREDDRPTIAHDDWTDPATIPLLDLSQKDVNREGLANAVRDAAVEWGFFQLINHGLSSETLREVQTQGFKFFELPAQVKQNLTARPGESEGPYIGDNASHKPTSLHWAESLFLAEEQFSEETIGRVWPDGNAEFLDTMTKFISGAKIIRQHLFELLAAGFGLKTNFFTEHSNLLTFRWNFYPACQLPSAVLGCRSHSDGDALTILQQDQVGGLQIFRDGQWMGIKPIEGALVINDGHLPLKVLRSLGNIESAWTNGRCKSVNHRVVVNESVQRLSLAAFCAVDYGFPISAPEELVDEEHPRLYRPFTFGEYLQHVYKIRQTDPNVSRNGVEIISHWRKLH